MRKIVFVFVIFILLLTPVVTKAAEINPDPDSYTFGATSEFSPYSTVGQGPNPTPGVNGLAPTGQNTWILYSLAILAIVSPLVYLGFRKIKK